MAIAKYSLSLSLLYYTLMLDKLIYKDITMSAEKKASNALARAHSANDNIELIMEFLKDLPMTLTLDHNQTAAYKKAFAVLEERHTKTD